ncbi:MAG: hypothetical protein ACPGVI_04775, partial [Crocinitomicaceae bacterium]
MKAKSIMILMLFVMITQIASAFSVRYYNKDSKQFRIDMGLDILEEELTKTHRKKVRATSTNKDVNV